MEMRCVIRRRVKVSVVVFLVIGCSVACSRVNDKAVVVWCVVAATNEDVAQRCLHSPASDPTVRYGRSTCESVNILNSSLDYSSLAAA